MAPTTTAEGDQVTDLAELALRAALVVGLLTLASGLWWLARGRDRGFRAAGRARSDQLLTAADLGLRLGDRATFVLFSSAQCSTCPQVRRALAGVAAGTPGVVVVDLGAEDRMELVRRHGVHRTPTVLLLDAAGRVRSRTSGPLTAATAREALARIDHPTHHEPTGSPRA